MKTYLISKKDEKASIMYIFEVDGAYPSVKDELNKWPASESEQVISVSEVLPDDIPSGREQIELWKKTQHSVVETELWPIKANHVKL